MDKEKLTEGVVALVWLSGATILEIIFGIAFFIWHSKLALFLLCVQTVIWLLLVAMFWIWKRGLH